jgi:hypothetical protein
VWLRLKNPEQGDTMSDSKNSGFGKFVPGFDFLQSLAQGASGALPQMPNLANWVSPSLNLEDLEKRIDELKAVHFWLNQNSKALGATIQALEVQKMTLATLKGMNFNLGDVANAFKPKAADSMASSAKSVNEPTAGVASGAGGLPQPPKAAGRKAAKPGKASSATATPAGGVAGLVDPMQLWGSLTQQFQQIAATAMKDVAKNTAVDMTKNMATGLAKGAIKATKNVASNAINIRARGKKT